MADSYNFEHSDDAFAIVTGATDGIGYEYACFFARKGYNLLLISRNQEKLEDTKQKIADKYPKCKEIRIHQADFTSTAIYTDIKRVVEELPRVDVLVNDVGISYPEYPTEIPGDSSKLVDDLISVNIFSVTRMYQIVLPLMEENRKGLIINISSFSATYPTPLLAVYDETKNYVDLFSRSMQMGYGHLNITIQSNWNRTESKGMNDLPELPFELVLSYLSLEDRLKARAVSRRWYHQINRFNVKTLCYSDRPAGFIEGKRRLVSGSFAQNFIYSTQFESFFNTFRPTILSNLKHLRLCNLRVSPKNLPAFFSTLQSFGQLEELDIIRFNFHLSSEELNIIWRSYHPNSGLNKEFKLTLPMLTSIRLEEVPVLSKLTLDAPQLLKIKVLECYNPSYDLNLSLELVHAESVEWLMIDRWAVVEVEKMKNLKYLYLGCYLRKNKSTSLSSLEQLKEICLSYFEDGLLKELFEQKQRHGRTDLKIYLWGLLLDGPDDPAIRSLQESFLCLAENPSRLTDQIPFWYRLDYSQIERVAPKIEMSPLKRFTDLTEIIVSEPVEDTDRFLNLLKNLENIVRLEFHCDQPPALFDRLPEHCAVQSLCIFSEPADIRFLFRLQHLIKLEVSFSIDAEAIRKIIGENEFLSWFSFVYLDKWVQMEIKYPKQFKVCIDEAAWREVPDLDAAINFIADSRQKKRKVKHLL